MVKVDTNDATALQRMKGIRRRMTRGRVCEWCNDTVVIAISVHRFNCSSRFFSIVFFLGYLGFYFRFVYKLFVLLLPPYLRLPACLPAFCVCVKLMMERWKKKKHIKFFEMRC